MSRRGLEKIEEQYKQRKSCLTESIQKIVELLRNENEIVLFGAGYCGKCIVECSGWLNTDSIKAACDNDKEKQGTYISGVKVISLEQGVRDYPNAVYVIANKTCAEEMLEQLLSKEIKRPQIYVVNNELDNIILFDQVAEISTK